MPKSEQIILGILIIFLVINLLLPIIGAAFDIEVLKFGSIFIKIFDVLTFILATIFVYRQIKRKGF